METIFKFVKGALAGQNQFASGGLLLMIVGAIGVYVRSLPLRLWSWVIHQTTMMLTVTDDDTAFEWIKEWFLEQKFMKRVRWLDLDTSLRGDDAALIPAPGNHRLYHYDESWKYVQAYTPRVLDSVILKPGEKEHLVEDIRIFRASYERYSKLGVPYHRGYLLYGPPGTGKTSLVSALGAKFGMSIYAMNLTELNDRTLKIAIGSVPANSIILFEDIDCMKAGNRRPETGEWAVKGVQIPGSEKVDPADRLGVTLSGLLNVVDGFHAPENVLFVMTTNKIEALDPALLRPGRIDYKLFLGNADRAQKIELYCRFFPQASEYEGVEFVESHFAETMAEFQGLLLGLEHEQPIKKEDCAEIPALT
jgi:hypothetical protein